MADEKKELDAVNENEVSGGYAFDAGWRAGDRRRPFEAISQGGNVLKRFATKEELLKWLDEKNLSSRELSWAEVEARRNGRYIPNNEERKRDQEIIITNYNDLMKQVEEYKKKWN